MYTVEINQITLSSDNDKRLETFDRFTTYPNGTNALKMRESEMMKDIVKDFFVERYADCAFYDEVILIILTMLIDLTMLLYTFLVIFLY